SGQRIKGSSRSSVTPEGVPTSGAAVRNQYDLSGDVSWDVDLWGRIRRSVEASADQAKASQADLAQARLSAQATLANTYFTLRFTDEQLRVLTSLVEGQARSFQIAQNRYKVGVAGKADVLTAQTQLESTQAQAVSVQSTRASLEHAIAVLIGKPPA